MAKPNIWIINKLLQGHTRRVADRLRDLVHETSVYTYTEDQIQAALRIADESLRDQLHDDMRSENIDPDMFDWTEVDD